MSNGWSEADDGRLAGLLGPELSSRRAVAASWWTLDPRSSSTGLRRASTRITSMVSLGLRVVGVEGSTGGAEVRLSPGGEEEFRRRIIFV